MPKYPKPENTALILEQNLFPIRTIMQFPGPIAMSIQVGGQLLMDRAVYVIMPKFWKYKYNIWSDIDRNRDWLSPGS